MVPVTLKEGVSVGARGNQSCVSEHELMKEDDNNPSLNYTCMSIMAVEHNIQPYKLNILPQ